MNPSFSLNGKNAVITGGTRGIGLAIARAFLQAGANVTICSRKRETVDEAIGELADWADQVEGVAAHVGRRSDLQRLISASEQRFGITNVLVNNAGTNPYFGPIVESEEAAWDKTMDVNLKGPYLLSCLLAKQLREAEGGSIINIASVAGLTPLPSQGIYGVSKAGLIMLTQVLAQELGPHQVRVNCICPGLIKTKLSEAIWSNPQIEAAVRAQKALGRMGTVDEIAGAALYFACDASSFTTGAVLRVDGGMRA